MAPNTITCLSCGASNPQNSEYCSNCGVSLSHEKDCPSCETKSPAAANFCVGCGFNFDDVQNPKHASSLSNRVFLQGLDLDNTADLAAYNADVPYGFKAIIRLPIGAWEVRPEGTTFQDKQGMFESLLSKIKEALKSIAGQAKQQPTIYLVPDLELLPVARSSRTFSVPGRGEVQVAYNFWLGDDEIQNFINHPGVDPTDPLAEDPFFTGLAKHVQKSYDDLSACGYNTDYPVFDKLRINRDVSPGLCTIAIDRREVWLRMQSTALMLADMAVDAYLKGEVDKAKELRKKSIKLFLTALDFGLGLIPVIGDMKDILECMTGYKVTTSQKLKTGEWIGACMGVIIGNRQIWVGVFDGVRMSGKYLSYLKKFLPENLSYLETHIAIFGLYMAIHWHRCAHT